jgi:hypothetical protein
MRGAEGGENEELLLNGYKDGVWGDEKDLKIVLRLIQGYATDAFELYV